MSFTDKRHCTNLMRGTVEAFEYVAKRKALALLNERTILLIQRIREKFNAQQLTISEATQLLQNARRHHKWSRRAILAGTISDAEGKEA